MIIDTHYHQILSASDEMIHSILTDPIRFSKVLHDPVDMDGLFHKAKEIWLDPDGEKLIAGMDESGIDFTLICGVDNIERELTPGVTRRNNKAIADIAQRHPDRVMALAGIDPRRDDARDMIRECMEEFGMKGLKYHPDFGFNPSGTESYKLLEIVNNMRGILLSHTGPLAPPSRCKYAEPMLLADIGVDFPEVKVIAAHMGYINWRPWAALAAHQPNLFGDLAMWDLPAFGNYELFCRELRDLIDFAGVDKILFGTDDPVFRIVRPTNKWIRLLKELPENAPPGISFTNEEVEAILGGNAAKLLGLNERQPLN
jgi:predicted TIM-barrel fold metal-dependent hydrolase